MNTTQRINRYQEVMQELAASRGYSVEELAERVRQVEPDVTLEDFTNWTRCVLGTTLGEVISLTEVEKLQIVGALKETKSGSNS